MDKNVPVPYIVLSRHHHIVIMIVFIIMLNVVGRDTYYLCNGTVRYGTYGILCFHFYFLQVITYVRYVEHNIL